MADPEAAGVKPASVAEKVKAVVRDLAGLPPGDGTPHGKGVPVDDEAEPPPGGLTADDAEKLPPHQGTGIAVE